MNNHKECPVCKATEFAPYLTCKDYTVSGEQFNIVSCKSCSFKLTNPFPDEQNLGKYYKSEDYISHSNTKKDIISQVYHLVRNYTLRRKQNLLTKFVSRGTILDYGCGTGMFLAECSRVGWKTIGVEPDQGARKIAQEMSQKVVGTLQELLPAKYDAITLWHVLEHVTQLDQTIGYFRSCLSENGVLVVAVPNYTSADANYYKEFWAAYDLPRHLYHFDKTTIERLFSRHGFGLVGTQGMKFDSFYVSMLSEKYKTGRINYLKAFWRGLRSNLNAKHPENYSSVIYILKRQKP